MDARAPGLWPHEQLRCLKLLSISHIVTENLESGAGCVPDDTGKLTFRSGVRALSAKTSYEPCFTVAATGDLSGCTKGHGLRCKKKKKHENTAMTIIVESREAMMKYVISTIFVLSRPYDVIIFFFFFFSSTHFSSGLYPALHLVRHE